MPEEPPALNRLTDVDPPSADGDAPTPTQVLDYLLYGVKDEEQKKVITWAFHSEWGGDPNSYNVRDMVIRKGYTMATLRNTARLNRGFSAFSQELNAILEAHEARVKEHAHAVTEGTLASGNIAGEIREELSKMGRTLEEKTAVDAQARVQALAALQDENRAMAQGIAKLQDMVAKVAMSSNIAMAAVMGVTVLVLVLGVLVVGHWFFIGV